MKYTLHILAIKLWEWESVKDAADFNIIKHGPDQYNTEQYNTATERVEEIKKAISIINSQVSNP